MEFDIIKQYFDWSIENKSIIQYIGDDCAIIHPTSSLAISTDTFIENTHFFKDTRPRDIAYKALVVNLSDIAAMGATPKYFTLNLTLPDINHAWLSEFSASLKDVATNYNLCLIGGDTTKGHLSVTITIIGDAPHYLHRNEATVGDEIFVSGTLGGANLALESIKTHKNISIKTLEKLTRPEARITLGQSILSVATSCIDISDGLVGDLSHILRASNVGADIWSAHIPLFNADTNLKHALYGGDDYELCFTAPKNAVNHIKNITQIGIITDTNTLLLDGLPIENKSFTHF